MLVQHDRLQETCIGVLVFLRQTSKLQYATCIIMEFQLITQTPPQTRLLALGALLDVIFLIQAYSAGRMNRDKLISNEGKSTCYIGQLVSPHTIHRINTILLFDYFRLNQLSTYYQLNPSTPFSNPRVYPRNVM